MSVQSVYPELEPLLPLVKKPIQYVGGELNSVVKEWDSARVRWALMYPDAYEVGVPNQGIQILYEVLNERDDVLAERTYSVWPDLEQLMREHQVPQFTVDGHRPVRAFDVLGVSFATELGYTNLLSALDLAGIPLSAADRGSDDPVVLAGGHAAFNPEPIAEFIDGAVLGDGEQAVLAITDLIRGWKAAGRPGGRDGLLLRLAASGGVYVPRFYDVQYLPGGAIGKVTPNRPGVPRSVGKHTVTDLDSWPYPRQPIVPVHESVHERFSVEIFRGCTRGCRFCQAGMITRPVRERSITTIGDMVEAGLRNSGFSEVGLLSLSSADHSEINEIAVDLADRYEGTATSLSLPSTRVDAFNVTLADELSRNGRRSGLTFAPEGGTDRIRKVINKMVTEDDLIKTVSTAYASGWRQVKLYFMCGLPTETDEDVLAIARVARRVIEAGRAASGRRDIRCTVSIGGFVPKPHTPFQWAAQCDYQTVDARLRALGDAIRADRSISRSIGFRYHDGRPSMVEGLLSRGDRRVAKVIRRAWEDGARFDGWSETFSYDRWERCAAEALAADGVDLAWYTTRERPYNEVLPWDHLDAGLDRDWMWQDWLAAIDPAPAEVEDCRWSPCFECGVCPAMDTQIETGPTGRRLLPLTVAGEAAAPGTGSEPGGGSAPGRDSGAGNGNAAAGVFVSSVSVPGGTSAGGPA
ncbi:MAG TPA: TIGR03960 family B12-binding radical SAM protein [Streptosporangiaceae bacterium]|nr:TIGR03960 family B12-binding radical SAM protein [Streptosporangiaceae bacterium]